MAYFEFNKYLINNYDQNQKSDYYLEFQETYNKQLNNLFALLESFDFNFSCFYNEIDFHQPLYTNMVFKSKQSDLAFVLKISSTTYYDLHGCLDSCEVFIKIGYFQTTTNQGQLLPANVNWFDTNEINFFNDQLVSQINTLVSKDKKNKH